MLILKIKIETDSRLTETLSDFLIGVMEMAVEVDVEDVQTVSHINGFLAQEHFSENEMEAIAIKVRSFAAEMSEIFGCGKPLVSVETIPDQDWSQNWKQFFKPFEIVSGLIVVPSWESFAPEKEQQVITMDPGMAFGTGHHATTKLCLQMMQDTIHIYKNSTILDVGTGTGILAMAAVLWGASKALAIDNDPEAVRVARENVLSNKLNKRIDISNIGLDRVKDQFPLVIANIIHDTLVALADGLSDVVAKNGFLVLSGLVHGTQTENITRCFEARNLELAETLREGEWGALKFKKKS